MSVPLFTHEIPNLRILGGELPITLESNMSRFSNLLWNVHDGRVLACVSKNCTLNITNDPQVLQGPNPATLETVVALSLLLLFGLFLFVGRRCCCVSERQKLRRDMELIPLDEGNITLEENPIAYAKGVLKRHSVDSNVFADYESDGEFGVLDDDDLENLPIAESSLKQDSNAKLKRDSAISIDQVGVPDEDKNGFDLGIVQVFHPIIERDPLAVENISDQLETLLKRRSGSLSSLDSFHSCMSAANGSSD